MLCIDNTLITHNLCVINVLSMPKLALIPQLILLKWGKHSRGAITRPIELLIIEIEKSCDMNVSSNEEFQ